MKTSKNIALILLALTALATVNAAVNYPVRFTYVDKVVSWSSPEKIAAEIGIPGYAAPTIYNYVAFAFWTYKSGPDDVVKVWADPAKYLGTTLFGKTKDQIQKNIKKRFNDNGIKLFISAFGATEFPTIHDPIDCANRLGKFVSQNNLDGVDIDYEDDGALQKGNGYDWLLKFQTQLKKLLPNHMITHAPQAPYFHQQMYKNGCYVKLHKSVGSTIDFYNIQFYNQVQARYDTYQTLFLSSGSAMPQTSVNEIIKKGIPANKVVVGKPATKADADNTGYVDPASLGQFVAKAYHDLHWYAGIMHWEYASDLHGSIIKTTAGYLKEQCAVNKDCK